MSIQKNTKTDIDKIEENEDEQEVFNLNSLSDKEIYLNIFDLSHSINHRLDLLKLYIQKFPEETGNVINRLNSMYMFSYSKVIENFLYDIIFKLDLDLYLKLESAKVLTYNTPRGYESLDYICSLPNNNLATLCKVESICYLTSEKQYIQNAFQYLLQIMQNHELECLYRYQIILSLERMIKEEEIKKDFIKRLCIYFLRDEKNLITGRILASQNLLRNYNPDLELRENIESNLLMFSTNVNLNENVRADAIDVLLQYGSDENRKVATRLIIALGTRNGKARTIFDNSQNVHHRSIEDSANKILEFLNTLQNKNKEGKEMDFDHIRQEILDLVEAKEKNMDKEKYKNYKETIEMALTRIFLDRAVYSQYNMGLILILIKMWSYIDNHEFRDVMKERLLEELHDASEVCSTGYAFRIVNVLSGFGELCINISFEDQIISNLEGRLYAEIKKLSNDDYVSLILEEMAIDSSYYSLRSNFLKFFREVISKIREEMYQEFRDYISDTDYDLYFKKAILHYEG